MKNKKILMMCIDAMFLSIILIMTFTPLGFITLFGVVSNTLIHIPVLIGALLFGYKKGLLYGTFFGLASLFKALTSPVTILDPYFVNPLVSVLPRVLFGLISGLVFDLIKKLPKVYNMPLLYVSSFILTILHSILTLGSLSLVHYQEINSLATSYYGSILLFIYGTIITNGLIEGGLALIITPSLYLPLKKYLNNYRLIEIK